MKIKILFAITVATALVSGWMLVAEKELDKSNALLLINIEALASGEGGGSNVRCAYLGSLDCPASKTKVGNVYISSMPNY